MSIFMPKNWKSFTNIVVSHIWTLNLSSTFNAFQVMINVNQFDTVTLSETWLHDNKHLLDYVKIPGYNFVYKDKEQKCGGGVGT